MLSTLDACNSQVGTDAREYSLRYSGRRRPDGVFHASSSVAVRKEVQHNSAGECKSPTHGVTPANEYAIIAAVERQP
jgi:hypothetical protein